MSSTTNQIQQEFHDKASKAFFSSLSDFRNVSSKIDRNKNEYLFQQLKNQYVLSLEKELQNIGYTVLNKYQLSSQVQGIDPVLHQLIKDYLHKFNQKVGDL